MPAKSVRRRPATTITSVASARTAPITVTRMATVITIITTKRYEDNAAAALRFLSHGRLERGEYPAARARQHLVLPSPAQRKSADRSRARESVDTLQRVSPP